MKIFNDNYRFIRYLNKYYRFDKLGLEIIKVDYLSSFYINLRKKNKQTEYTLSYYKETIALTSEYKLYSLAEKSFVNPYTFLDFLLLNLFNIKSKKELKQIFKLFNIKKYEKQYNVIEPRIILEKKVYASSHLSMNEYDLKTELLALRLKYLTELEITKEIPLNHYKRAIVLCLKSYKTNLSFNDSLFEKIDETKLELLSELIKHNSTNEITEDTINLIKLNLIY